jgi:hypothetical protein
MGAAEALIVIDERRKAAELPAPDSSVIAPVIGNAEANVATA